MGLFGFRIHVLGFDIFSSWVVAFPIVPHQNERGRPPGVPRSTSPSPLGPYSGPIQGPYGGDREGAVSYERGTPVSTFFSSRDLPWGGADSDGPLVRIKRPENTGAFAFGALPSVLKISYNIHLWRWKEPGDHLRYIHGIYDTLMSSEIRLWPRKSMYEKAWQRRAP